MILKKAINALKSNPDLLIRKIVLDTAQKKKQIIHGTRAVNPQLPSYLRKDTIDYDILTKKPKKVATEVLEKLKRATSQDVRLEKGKHKGTYKIKLNKESIIDYTQLKSKPKTKKILGNEYYDIKGIKRNIQRRLKDPSKQFRAEKDSDVLRRIKFSEETFDF